MAAAWGEWIGRAQTQHDVVSANPARALAATLDRDDVDVTPGAVIPGLWIWLCFPPVALRRDIGPDGHPRRGGFLPPIVAPRRMWAGSRCVFHAPLRIGAALERTSVIAAIAEKDGRAGPLTVVTVRHAVTAEGGLVYEEDQDLVFMPIPERFEPPPPTPAPPAAWSEPVVIDPVLLFRFSALTFNGHRIHYDRAYATGAEKYPGLVVHGPLQAILMFDAALRRAPHRTPARFSFRGVRPLFDLDEVRIGGAPRADGGVDLFTANGDDAVCAQATLAFAP